MGVGKTLHYSPQAGSPGQAHQSHPSDWQFVNSFAVSIDHKHCVSADLCFCFLVFFDAQKFSVLMKFKLSTFAFCYLCF